MSRPPVTKSFILPKAHFRRCASTTTSIALPQPGGWLGGTIKVDWPTLTDVLLYPFECVDFPNGANGSLAFYNWFAFEFWRFVQKEVGRAQRNLEEVMTQIEKAIAAHATRSA